MLLCYHVGEIYKVFSKTNVCYYLLAQIFRCNAIKVTKQNAQATKDVVVCQLDCLADGS